MMKEEALLKSYSTLPEFNISEKSFKNITDEGWKYACYEGNLKNWLSAKLSIKGDLKYEIPNLHIDYLLYQMQEIMYNVYGVKIDRLNEKEEEWKVFFRSTNPINFNEILPNVQIFLVTSEIQGKKHELFNIFTRKEEIATVPDPIYYEIEDEKGLSLLGCYTPANGAIYLWVDKFEKLNQQFSNLKYLVFQKVLLHEFIHLLFDIIRKSLLISSKPLTIREEETKDNLLVLNCYANSSADCIQSKSYKDIRSFIEQQPKAYSDAITEFESDTTWLSIRKNITNFLSNTK